MSRSATNKKLAQDRAKQLWDYYLDHDEKITCSEVYRLTGRKAANLYTSFQTQGIQGPPIWDSNAEIRKRQIAALWARSQELGRDWLTSKEAAAALGQNTKNIWVINKRLAGKIPEIRALKRRITKAEIRNTGDREEIPPEGALLAYEKRESEEPGQVIYSLR